MQWLYFPSVLTPWDKILILTLSWMLTSRVNMYSNIYPVYLKGEVTFWWPFKRFGGSIFQDASQIPNSSQSWQNSVMNYCDVINEKPLRLKLPSLWQYQADLPLQQPNDTRKVWHTTIAKQYCTLNTVHAGNGLVFRFWCCGNFEGFSPSSLILQYGTSVQTCYMNLCTSPQFSHNSACIILRWDTW